jgi:hypothetical protein
MSLQAFLETMATGKLHQESSPWIGGANLIPLVKPDNRVRPIAVGETMRRAVSKLLADQVMAKVRDHLFPLQLGVGI